MKRLKRKLYLWFKQFVAKFRSMDSIQTHNKHFLELQKMQKTMVDSLGKYISSNSNDFIQYIVNYDPKNKETVSFSIGTYNCLVTFAIKPFTASIVFSTSISNKEIEKLSGICGLNLSIKTKGKAIDYENFGSEYVGAILDFLSQQETDEYKKFTDSLK